MSRYFKNYNWQQILMSASLLAAGIFFHPQANAIVGSERKIVWGVYAQAGGHSFRNSYKYDNSIYRFPVQLQYSAGVQCQYFLNSVYSSLIFSGGFQRNKMSLLVEKYNNRWNEFQKTNLDATISAAFRQDWSPTSSFYMQSGLLLGIGLGETSSTFRTEYSNNNNVRDFLGATYIGATKRFRLNAQFNFGFYLDKYKQHELAACLQLPFMTLFAKGKAAYLKQDFTFSDNTTASYQIDVNGLPLRFGLQYNFWF